ncbi:ammonium transporter [Campylobacter jejuni]|nr:ammonium transporter [Campylobacter jejuni]
MHGIGGVCEGIATGLFASVKANPNMITKNALGGGVFYQWKFRAFKRANSYYYDLYDFFSSHKLYYFLRSFLVLQT